MNGSVSLSRRLLAAAALGYLGVVLVATLAPFEFRAPWCLRFATAPAPEWAPPAGLRFRGGGHYRFDAHLPELEAALPDGSVHLFVEFEPERARPRARGYLLSYAAGRGPEAVALVQRGASLILRARVTRPGDRSVGRNVELRALLDGAQRHVARIVLSEDRIVLSLGESQRIVYRVAPPLSVDLGQPGARLQLGSNYFGRRTWQGTIRRLDIATGPRVDGDATPRGPVEAAAGIARLASLSAPEHRLDAAWRPHRHRLSGGNLLCAVNQRPFVELRWSEPPWVDFALNLAMLVPFAFLLRLIGVAMVPAVALCVMVSAGIEATQVFVPGRWPGVTDLILNAFGGLCVFLLPRRWLARGPEPGPAGG